jgi:hypothetical protein
LEHFTSMTTWFVHKMRLIGAIVTIAVYAFCATAIPATASTFHCSFHPCHEIVQSAADGSSGHHFHSGAAPTSGMAKAALGGEGTAKSHADPGCQFSCSAGLSPEAAPVMARTSEVSAPFGVLARDPDGRSPERLVRPPRIPLA